MLEKKPAILRDAPPEPLPSRGKRADRALEIRRKLIDSAAKVVGAEGYANASVAKITALAEIAQGTFYNYFSSQQELFDHLLPELGGELLDFIRQCSAGESDSLRREEIGFRAFFEFLARRPEFYRVLNEAETFAPKAYHDHMRNMAQGYMRALARSHAKGELPAYEPRELEVIVYALLAVRNYISYRYLYRDGGARRLPPWVADAYAKFVTGGLKAGTTSWRTERPAHRDHDAPGDEPQHLALEFLSDGPGIWTFRLALSDPDRDDYGQVRQGILLQAIEAASRKAAEVLGRGSARVQSLSTSFPVQARSTRLDGRVLLAPNGQALHVSVAVEQEGGGIAATAQALFTLDEPANGRWMP